MSSNKTSKSEAFRVLLLMALCAGAIYFRTLKTGFIWDDWSVIVSNGAIRKWWDLPAIWNAFNTRSVQGFTLALNYAAGQLDVTGYRVFNVALHALNAWVLYFLSKQTLDTPRMKDSPLFAHRDSIALFSALIFLVHPIQTTAVNYIWQRAATLATGFYLASVFFYAKARLTNLRRYQVLALFTTVAGMFSKEITATLPITLAVYEFLFFGPVRKDTKKRFFFLLPFLLTLAVIPATFMRSDAVTMALMRPDAVRTEQPALQGSSAGKLDITRWVSEETMPRKDYYFTQLNVIRTYLRLLVFPVRQNIDYDYPIARGFGDPGVLLSAVLLGLLLAAAAGATRKYPLPAFGALWFFIALSVESLVVQKDVLFEHRVYLLTAGFVQCVVPAAYLVFRNKRVVAGLLSAAALIFSVAAYRRNEVWRDDLSLWKDVIQKSPNKVYGYNFAGVAYWDRRDYANAIDCYEKAIALKPDFESAQINLGSAYGAAGRHEDAIRSYQRAVEIQPNAQTTISAYNNLGIEYFSLGKKDEAEVYFKKAVEKAAQIDPKQAEPCVNLGMLYGALGRREEALAFFQKAVVIDPENLKARQKLAEALAATP